MDDIIARKPASPLGTSLIVVTTAALVAAITLGIMTHNTHAADQKSVSDTISADKKVFNKKYADLEKVLKDTAVAGAKSADTEEDSEEESEG